MIEINQIIDYVKSLPDRQWYGLEEVANGLNTSYSEIQMKVTESDAFVTSLGDNNEVVISLRTEFRKNEPVFRKIIGAFRNRID